MDKQIEEMQKLQNKLINRSCTEYNLATSLLLMEAAEAIGNLIAGRREWISAEDRLPEPCKNVLIYFDESVIETDFITVQGEWCVHTYHTVTHWMPLPEPPTEKEN